MGLQGYVGSSEDVRRIRRQEQQREEAKKKFEEQKQKGEREVDKAGFRQFGMGQAEVLEHAFKNETVGLVTREEFVNKRQTLADRFEEDKRRKKRDAEEAALRDKEKRKKQKAKVAAAAKLSFGGDEEEEEADENGAGPANGNENGNAKGSGSNSGKENGSKEKRGEDEAAARPKYSTLGKDPNARTDFLPDKDAELAEEELREQLKVEWQLRQQAIKNEPLEITYSYWDGTGHRRKLTCRKGDTIGEFLHRVREQLAVEFREMRATSASNLMYIKEDLILPQSLSFYDLITSRARGKSGPLFHFDVHEDVRVVNDASVEKDESHAGKVVDRHWYNRNKHIFPASRWEQYDPEKNFDRYTVHGAETK